MQRVQMICHSENGFALLRSPAERGRDVIIDYVGDLAHDFERRGMHGVATFSVSLPMLRSRGSSLRTRLPRGDPLGPGSTFRSLVLRPALSLVSVDTAGSSDHQARDAGALASGWVSQLLTMQISEWGRASADLRALIEQMSVENPLWGAPRIHGELLKLGFQVAQSTVAKYIVRRYGRPPDQSWWTFLRNHMPEIAAMDLFVVPTLDESDANGANKPCYAISGPNDPRTHAAPPPSVRKLTVI